MPPGLSCKDLTEEELELIKDDICSEDSFRWAFEKKVLFNAQNFVGTTPDCLSYSELGFEAEVEPWSKMLLDLHNGSPPPELKIHQLRPLCLYILTL